METDEQIEPDMEVVHTAEIREFPSDLTDEELLAVWDSETELVQAAYDKKKRQAEFEPKTPEPKRQKVDEFSTGKSFVKVGFYHFIYPDLYTEKLFDFAANTFMRRWLRTHHPNHAKIPTTSVEDIKTPPRQLIPKTAGLGQLVLEVGTELLASFAESTSNEKYMRLVVQNDQNKIHGSGSTPGIPLLPCACCVSASLANQCCCIEFSSTHITTPLLAELQHGAFPTPTLRSLKRRLKNLNKRFYKPL